MRILLMPSSYHPVLGGLQTATHRLAQGLIRCSHKVRVVTKHYPRFLPVREVLDGVPVYRWLFLTPELRYFRQGRLDLFGASLFLFPLTLFRLIYLMRVFRPDVLNIHFPDAQVPFVLRLRQRFDFRLVVSLHGHEIERWYLDDSSSIVHRQSPAFHRLRMLLREADAITACSRYLLDKAIQLEPLVAQKGHVIHNGIDPSRFEDTTSHHHPRPYILAFGRLTYQKGFDMLLEAFAHATSGHLLELDIILAGEGEEREALQAQAQRLELNERVHFIGRVTPEEIVRLLNGCLFVVVPSRSDTFGIAALEALAAGKPIMATRVGGLVELLENVRRPNVNQTDDAVLWTGDLEPQTLLVSPEVNALECGLERWVEQMDGFATAKKLGREVTRPYHWERIIGKYERCFQS